MDPDTALRSARECMSTACMTDDDEIKEEALTNMMESFDALDGWLSKGGFLPAEWDRHRASVPQGHKGGTGMTRCARSSGRHGACGRATSAAGAP